MSEHRRVSQAEYARHRAALGLSGGSRAAVHKAVAAGRISIEGGLIDPERADVEWKRTRAPGSGGRRRPSWRHPRKRR